jgi:predicted alpha/beta-fold hydrolase
MLSKYFDINEDGFSIRSKLYYGKDPRNIENVVIATYGFGGNKDNKAVEKFAERIISKYKSFGVICFDWPCHGKDARNKLKCEECITYLDLAVRHAEKDLHAKVLYNYSSSFGAYITLRYFTEKKKNPFHKTAFRCAAVKMYEAMSRNFTEDDWSKLNKGKEIQMGFERKIKISKEFIDDLKEHDVSKNDYLEYADDIFMVHGTKDTSAPLQDAIAFSENNVIELMQVKNADHAFSNPQYMDLAIGSIISFFHPDD